MLWGEILKNLLLRDFMATLTTFTDREYLMAKIELEVAPILAGLKPSAVMTFRKDSRNSYQKWETYKEVCCASLTLNYYEMRKTEHYVLVLLYDPALLTAVVTDAENKQFLRNMGYQEGLSLPQVLQILKERFAHACPHEVGLFLGISKEDVHGFIQNEGGCCLFCGYWKVYHKPQDAYKLFCQYDLARHKVMQRICQHKTMAAVSA